MGRYLAVVILISGCGYVALEDHYNGPYPDARAGDATSPDASGTTDACADAATSNADDLSLCPSTARIATMRTQLSSYGVMIASSAATDEDYPVSQYRPDFGVTGYGPAFKDNIVAIRVRVPVNYVPTDTRHLGFVKVAEAPGEQAVAQALCVTSKACDFSPCPYQGDTGPSSYFTVGSQLMIAGAQNNFDKGQVFWINIAHRTINGDPSCVNYGTCGVLVDFASPNRY